MAADARMTLRKRSIAAGDLSIAISPMFQTTGRCASRLVVSTIRMRPRRYSAAMRSSMSRSMYLAIRFASGVVSASAGPPKRAGKSCVVMTSLCLYCVQIVCNFSSWDGPRNANGAMMAPALTPVTTSNSGRSPRRLHPARTPAPNAPSDPPPDSANVSMTFRPLMRLASFAIGGMCAVRRLISATGSRGTSSAQKRTPDMSGTSAVAASLALAMPLRGIVAAQPESANAIAVKRPIESLRPNTKFPLIPTSPILVQVCSTVHLWSPQRQESGPAATIHDWAAHVAPAAWLSP